MSRQPFDVDLPFDPPLPEPTSRARFRTAERRRRLDAGLHPLAGGPVNDEQTCGSCYYHEVTETGRHVCALAHGDTIADIEIRLRWPACDRWLTTNDEEVDRADAG